MQIAGNENERVWMLENNPLDTGSKLNDATSLEGTYAGHGATA